jgi:parallel beta-helix repeat protein
MSKKLVLAAAATTLCIAVLGFGAGPGAATVTCDLYASTSGSDAAAGTSAAPFRTTQKLLNSLSAGQTGCLAAGTYNETVRVNHGGAAGSPIRLTSAPGGRATIVGRFYVPDESNDVVLADLNLNGKNSSELPSPTVNGDRITFTGNDVTDDHTGICFDIGSRTWGTAVDVVLDGNRIHDCGRLPFGSTNHDHGIYVESTRRVVITNNYVYDNADRGIQLYPDAQGSKVTNNLIDGNGEGIIFSGDDGVASNDNLVTKNIISNSRVRYNVESWWPEGNPVGTGNVATDNCLWNGTEGNVSEEVGFSADGNAVQNPLFVDRASKEFTLQSGSPCAGYGPSGSTVQAPPPPPPPPPPVLVAPSSAAAPVLSGSARTGDRLGVSTGSWNGSTPFTFGYRWERCDRKGASCVATGVTSSSYRLTRADIGWRLRAVVTATNPAGSASATAGPSAVVRAKSGRPANALAKTLASSGLRRFLLRR